MSLRTYVYRCLKSCRLKPTTILSHSINSSERNVKYSNGDVYKNIQMRYARFLFILHDDNDDCPKFLEKINFKVTSINSRI